MKRTFLFIFTALAVLMPVPLSSCGWNYTGEEFRFWLLQPELADARGLHPFYFTTEVLNGPDYQEIEHLPYAVNVAEWKSVVGKDIPDSSITAVLYDMDAGHYWDHQEGLIKTNAFLRKLASLKDGWLAYIDLAKTSEVLCYGEDPWGFEAKDVPSIKSIISSALDQLKRAKHPMLRARLAYQLVRLSYYGGTASSGAIDPNAIYSKHLLPLRGKSWLEPSAAFYLASMLQNPARDLAFAELFDRATDKQFRMVQLFVSKETDHYLELAKTDKQRATLLVMRDLQHPGRALADLERIAAWDPGNRHLPLLLTREVNKLEDWLLTTTLTDLNAAIRQWNSWEDTDPPVTADEVLHRDLDYLHEVQAFVARVAQKADVDQRPLLALLNGHLSLIAGDLGACRSTMNAVMEDPKATPLMRLQAGMDRILVGILGSPTLTDETGKYVLALVELVNTEPELASQRSVLLGQLHLYLGKKLIARGEVAQGIFLLARSNRMYGDMLSWSYKNARHVAFEKAAPADFDRMIALLDKPSKTPFERYLTARDERPEGWEDTNTLFDQNELTRERLLDYKATWYMQRDSLEQAAAAFRQIPDSFWTGFPYALFADDDPFVVNIEDPHNYNKQDSAHYNKRTIVERMIALKAEAARNPKKRALNNYLLGNAYYNMTWHGKYWIMTRIQWSIHEFDGGTEATAERSEADMRYFGTALAEPYYVAAMASAKDPVLQAMACRMAGECNLEREFYTGRTEEHEWSDPYVGLLRDSKSQEAFAAIEDCSGYADFVRRFR